MTEEVLQDLKAEVEALRAALEWLAEDTERLVDLKWWLINEAPEENSGAENIVLGVAALKE